MVKIENFHVNSIFNYLTKGILKIMKKSFLYSYNHKYCNFSIFDEEWDNLIILDACRYDYFKKVYKQFNLPGKLEKRISSATETTEFLKNNFREKHEDIVYVSANPFVDLLIKDKVWKTIPVWNLEWSDKYNTVHPESVFKWAVYALKEYCYNKVDKRLIIHFIQPHSPYINGYGEVNTKKNFGNIIKNKKIKILYKLDDKCYISNWPYIGIRNLPVSKIKIGYNMNLLLAMDYVKKLINLLPGRTIVTADHGEAFGEKIHPLLPLKIYGHPVGIRHKVLVEVPWLVVEEEEKNNEEVENEVYKIWLSCKIRKKMKGEKI